VSGLLYRSRGDVEAAAPPMAEIRAPVEAVFRDKGEGRVEMPAKIGIHPGPADFLHAMPAFVPGAPLHLGLAITNVNVATALRIYRRALAPGLGTRLPL